MSHLATVQDIYAAFGRGDVPAILEHLAADMVWEDWEDNRAQKAGLEHLARREGREAVTGFFAWAATAEITTFDILAMMEGPDRVAVEVVIEASLVGGGHFRDEEIHLWSFDANGKVTRMRHYTDTAKHIEAGD